MKNSRRDFIKKTGIIGLGINSFPQLTFEENFDKKGYEKGLTILFQGDSITDGNRTRNNDWNHVLGHGYQFIIASKLWYENPKSNLMFYNRGISGNRVTDLENRWQKDAIDLKPDVLSILIGVNDTASVVNNQNPQPIETFEKSYRNILEKTKVDLPNVKLVLCEPFILKLGHVEKNTEIWESEIQKRQEITRKLATEFEAIFVPFQQLFIDACKKAEAKFWIWDGIHPMPAGHELMARQWLKVVGKRIKF
jgi:lysophospholipase L1-like esterase